MNSIHKNFSHIYIEKRAFLYPLTQTILEQLPRARIIQIQHYKEFFNRPGQNFQIQKKSRKLILAVKEAPRIYPATGLCSAPDGMSSYYATPVINCLFDCHYCFLQGMYPSANLVVFVNQNDFYREAKRLAQNGSVHLNLSYETDLAALERLTGLCRYWIDAVSDQKNLTIEIRTKGLLSPRLIHTTPNPQTILAWTLSPQLLIDRYEPMTPSLEQRLNTIRKFLKAGWHIRLCWDPMLAINGWEELYRQAVHQTFTILDSSAIHDTHIGVFRMHAEFYKNICAQREDTDILYLPTERYSSAVSYPRSIKIDLIQKMIRWLSNYLPSGKIKVIG